MSHPGERGRRGGWPRSLGGFEISSPARCLCVASGARTFRKNFVQFRLGLESFR
jgi:hypothetical protein